MDFDWRFHIGDIADLNPTKSINKRKVFKGKCIGMIQATDKNGNIEVTVKSKNLDPVKLSIIAV